MFYLGFGLQLFGLTLVGICFIMGMIQGDYGKLELLQLVGGSCVFYIGFFLRKKA